MRETFFLNWLTRLWELANAKSVGQADKLEIQVRVDVAALGLKSTKQASGQRAGWKLKQLTMLQSFLKNNLIYLSILAVLGLHCYEGCSLAAVRRAFL